MSNSKYTQYLGGERQRSRALFGKCWGAPVSLCALSLFSLTGCATTVDAEKESPVEGRGFELRVESNAELEP